VAHEHRGAALELRAHGVEAGDPLGSAGRHERGDGQRLVPREERRGVHEVGLGEQEHGRHPRVVGRDEAAVHHPGAWLGLGEGGDDDELVRVGDHDALGGVHVVGRAAQRRPPLLHADDPGERVGPTADLAHHVHPIADDDARPAQFARLHRSHGGPGVRQHGVPAAVDGEDHPGHGVGVLGALLGSRPGAARVGPHPDGGLVDVAALADHVGGTAVASIAAHCAGKSGRVFAVVPTFSTPTPGTRRPRIAPKVAMRWSW